MKSIILMNGTEKIIADDEAENVKRVIESTKFVELRDGSLINTSSIVSIDNISEVPYWSVYPVYETKLGKYIIREGEKCFLSPENIAEIKFVIPKEYEQKSGVLRQIQSNVPVLPGSV